MTAAQVGRSSRQHSPVGGWSGRITSIPSVRIDGDGNGPRRSTTASVMPRADRHSVSSSRDSFAFGQPGLLNPHPEICRLDSGRGPIVPVLLGGLTPKQRGGLFAVYWFYPGLKSNGGPTALLGG